MPLDATGDWLFQLLVFISLGRIFWALTEFIGLRVSCANTPRTGLVVSDFDVHLSWASHLALHPLG